MRTFRDLNGEDWSLAVTVGSRRRVKDVTGVDLCDVVLAPHKTRLGTDEAVLLDLLLVLLESQLSERQRTPEAFLEQLDETVCTEALEALQDAVVDFFHASRRGPAAAALTRFRTIHREELTKAATKATELIEGEEFARIAREVIHQDPPTTGESELTS